MVDSPSTLREKEWEQVLESALTATALVVTDTNGTIVWANQAYSELTGYTLNEAIGSQIGVLKSGRQDASFYEKMWKSIKNGEKWSGMLINRRKDGSEYYEEMEIRPVIDASDDITHFVAVKRNITERKVLQDQLQKSETQKKTIVNNLTELMAELKEITKALDHARSQMHAMLDATTEGMMLLSPTNEVLRINKSFERMFSVREKEVRNRYFLENAEHWNRVFRDDSVVQDILDESKCDTFDDRIFVQKWPAKRELQVYSASVVNAEDELLGRLMVFRDVSREREVERLKSEFVSLVTHEFRTPLTSIKGYTEMMLDGDTGRLSSEQRDFLETVLRNANHLSELVEELLDVSRIEAGAIKLNIQEIDIVPVIEDIVDRMRPQLEKKNQRLSIETPRDVPKVSADEMRTAQIILNLVSNAHKYTPSGGDIVISVEPEDEYLLVDVKDNGIGLSQEEQEKIFSKFFRAENPETIKEGGTGLGLWITRSLVEMQGGEVSVDSNLGEGSTFSFTIPMC